jgi:phosphoenolpyruvate carboxykinase (ATP)
VKPRGEKRINYGNVNQPFDRVLFNDLWRRAAQSLTGHPVFVQDLWAGADPTYTYPVRVITKNAWHSLFIHNMLLRQAPGGNGHRRTPLLILHVPDFDAGMTLDGKSDPRFIGADLHRRMVLITGTAYAGEIKKSVFTFMNYWLPQKKVFPMHCSANIGMENGDVAFFFGLSGTGKTTLSADPRRLLIGDDEHGWGRNGVFNIEGGCYAKTKDISLETEPEIYLVARKRGTVLENVKCHPDREVLEPDFFNTELSENGRASFPLDAVQNAVLEGRGGHPQNIFLLTCDAFGVMPPISKLTPEQAAHQFVMGYTSKVAGTELGAGGATFSTGYGEPFLPLLPAEYATMFMGKINEHQPNVWLVNTGYTGTGQRMPIALTRQFVEAAYSGALDEGKVDYIIDNPFGLRTPVFHDETLRQAMDMQSTWQNEGGYRKKCDDLAAKFRAGFKRHKPHLPEAVKAVADQFGHHPANG